MHKQEHRTQEVEPEMVKYASPGVVCLNKVEDPRGCSSLWDGWAGLGWACEPVGAHLSKIGLGALLEPSRGSPRNPIYLVSVHCLDGLIS